MASRSDPALENRIAALRTFNRFYTRRIGVLDERHLQSPFSLAEARVLYELTQPGARTATEIAERLGLDAGYLSRILRRFDREKLIERRPSKDDARRSMIELTPKGRKAFAPLEARTLEIAEGILGPLSNADRDKLLAGMHSIESILEPKRADGTFTLRTHRYGDMAWIVQRQIEAYEREYGWRERFEYLMVQIAADILREFDASRERIWIAERGGERVGSVCIVAESRTVARLRLLLVEPAARGAGLGRALVEQSIEFSRSTGYRKIVLWTQHNLNAARSLYEEAGFQLTGKKKHSDFGVPLVGETWELVL